jgi:diguanylate cyclase (GGDEF)-like protein
MSSLIKKPSDCLVLIVDDEPTVCELLVQVLSPLYKVISALNGTDACRHIEKNDFDVVVTDLRLPDMTGIDVMGFAKSKDAYTEVVLVTGYASLESATNAIDLGAMSYIEKPLVIQDFLIQIEKAIASRLFHLKSISLMQNSGEMSAEFKDHLGDITSLYYFTRKLTLSLELSEIMRITLGEALRKSNAAFCAIGVSVFGYRDIYAMSATGEVDPAVAKELFLRHWDAAFPYIQKGAFVDGKIEPVIFKGKQGSSHDISTSEALVVPMLVTGATMGSLVVFFNKNGPTEPPSDQYFLYIISSIVSSLIQHSYAVLQARQLAKTDGLTGIANHRSFHEALDREIARANRKGSPCSLMIMDIDDFKKVNDTYGHLVGDAVLKNLVQRVLENIRTVDIFARYGGEEFGLILPETDLKGAEILASRIKDAITTKPFVYAQHILNYSASIGIAVFNPERPVKKDALVDQADAAMYSSKRSGKNRITISSACL